jgi:hypothetical protein
MWIIRPILLAALSLAALPLLASSHNEAPLTALSPVTDDTDFYLFRDPNDPAKVNLIANRFGLIEPQGGPNFARFAEGARYDIKVDNDGDAREDVTFRFTFKTVYRAPETFLYALPGVKALDDPNLLVVQTYSLDKITGPADDPPSSAVTRLLTDQPVLPPNIGSKTFPDGYRNLRNGIQSAGERRVFVGPRQDPFFVDLGMTFDAIHLNVAPGVGRPGVGVGNMGGGKDTLYGFAVLSTSIQVPIAELTKGGVVPSGLNDPAAIVSGWASISVPATMTRNADGSVTWSGEYRQVSRLGNPLVNEVLIGVGSKDRWNATHPKDESQFRAQELRPVLATYMNVLFGVNVPPNTADRADLELALFKGLPVSFAGLPTQRPNEVYADQLRLNVAVPPTPFASASRLGVIGGDVAGFPNGRRVCDDVVDIALRVVAGVLLGPPYNGSPNKDLGDGVNGPQRGCRTDFPYMWSPTSGFDAVHTPEANPPAPASFRDLFEPAKGEAEPF